MDFPMSWSTSCGTLHRDQFRLVSKFGQLRDQLAGPDFHRPTVEMRGAQVLVLSAVLQHVVNRGQQRSRHRADRLLWSAPAGQALKQRLEVTVFLVLGRPGALHE